MAWTGRRSRESVIEALAVRMAEERGGMLVKLSPSTGRKHWPDRALLHPARPPAFLELKAAGEYPSPEQWEQMRRLEAAGYVTGWASTPAALEVFFQAALRSRRKASK